MCTVVGDIICPPWRGWLDMVVPGVSAIKLVIRLDLRQPKVVLGEG